MRQITTPLLTGVFSEDVPPVEIKMEIHACTIGQGEKVHLAVALLRDGHRLSVSEAVCFKGKKPTNPNTLSSLLILPDDTYVITCKHCSAKLNDLLDQRVLYLEQKKTAEKVAAQKEALLTFAIQTDALIREKFGHLPLLGDTSNE